MSNLKTMKIWIVDALHLKILRDKFKFLAKNVIKIFIYLF